VLVGSYPTFSPLPLGNANAPAAGSESQRAASPNGGSVSVALSEAAPANRQSDFLALSGELSPPLLTSALPCGGRTFLTQRLPTDSR